MLALTLGGVITLNRVVTGRWSLWPLVAALLSHNLYTLFGFFSFDLGVALVLWALAGRLWLMNRSLAVQLAVGSAFSVVLIICHLSAFGIYALMLAGVGIDMLLPRGLHSAPRIWERIGGLLSSIRHRLPRAIAMSLELVPACAVFAMMSTAGQGRARYDVPYWPSKIFNAVKTVSSGSEIGDVAFLLGAGAVGLLLIFCGRLRVARPLLPGLLFLIVAYFLMPAYMNSGSYVDSRLIMPILFLAVAAVQFDVRWDGVWRPRLIRALVAGICAALIVKQAALFVLWHQGGQTLARVGEALNALPSGAVILQAECQPDATDIRGVYEARQPPLQSCGRARRLEQLAVCGHQLGDKGPAPDSDGSGLPAVSKIAGRPGPGGVHPSTDPGRGRGSPAVARRTGDCSGPYRPAVPAGLATPHP